MKNPDATAAERRLGRQRGFTPLEFILITGILTLGTKVAVEHLKATGVIGARGSNAAAGSTAPAGAPPLAAMQALAIHAEQEPLDITPDEMRELITTVKGLEGGGKFDCPGSAGLKQDPIFSSSFGLASGGAGGP